MEYEIFSRGKGIRVIDSGAQAAAGTVYSNWIDTMMFDSFVCNLRVVGTAGEISAIGAEVSESSAGSHSDAVADDGSNVLYYPIALPVLPAVAPGTAIRIGLTTKPRYFRLAFTLAATACGVSLTISGDGELSHAKVSPEQLASSVLQASQISDPGDIISGSDTFIGNPPIRKTTE